MKIISFLVVNCIIYIVLSVIIYFALFMIFGEGNNSLMYSKNRFFIPFVIQVLGIGLLYKSDTKMLLIGLGLLLFLLALSFFLE